jgi:integrase
MNLIGVSSEFVAIRNHYIVVQNIVYLNPMTYLGDLPRQEVVQRIFKHKNEKARIVFAIAYLTGSRIGEIVRYHKDRKETPEKDRVNPPLKASSITFKEINGHKLMIVKVLREKLTGKNKSRKFKLIYIDIEGRDRELAKIILKRRLEIKQTTKDGYLVDVSTRQAQKYFQKSFPEFRTNIHHFRHWRATHMLNGEATGEPIPKDVVATILGHSNIRTTDVYDHVSVETYIEKFGLSKQLIKNPKNKNGV